MRLVTNGSFRFLYPFLPVVARDVGLTTARSGLLLSALALGGVLAPPMRRALTGGHEQDRKLLVRAGSILAVGALVASIAPVAAVAVLGFLLLGIGKPLSDIGAISYVSGRVPGQRLARATSTMELTWAGGLIVVAPIAGAIAGVTSWRVPIAVLGVIVAAIIGIAAVRMDPDPTIDHGTQADRAPLGRSAAVFLAVVFLVFSALEVSFAAFGVWLEDAYGASIGQLGGFAALTATGELVGSGAVLLFGDRLGKARVLAVGLVITAVGASLLPFATSAMTAAGALGVSVLGSETAIVAAIPLAATVIPHARSRFFARMVAMGSLARLLMAGLAPAIYTTFGIVGNATVSVTVSVLAMAFLRWLLRTDPTLRN
jgi:predicted MFS family arabinose efflux permease